MDVTVSTQTNAVNIQINLPAPININISTSNQSGGGGVDNSELVTQLENRIDFELDAIRSDIADIKAALSGPVVPVIERISPTVLHQAGIDLSNAPAVYRALNATGSGEDLNYVIFGEKLTGNTDGYFDFSVNSKNSYIGLSAVNVATNPTVINNDMKIGLMLTSDGGNNFVRTKDNDSFFTKGFGGIGSYDGRTSLSPSATRVRIQRQNGFFKLSQTQDGVNYTDVYAFNYAYSGDMYVVAGIIDGAYPGLLDSRIVDLKTYNFI